MTDQLQHGSPSPGWYPDPSQPGVQRWWDGAAWSAHESAAPTWAPPAAAVEPRSAEATNRSKGAALEQRIGSFMSSIGYAVRTNVVLEGKSGSRHEIDVLGEKHDQLSTFRVAVECKAWSQPIEKDVVAKFDWVLKDLGMREGIIVALGGMRSGAATAARELGITLWGPEEIEERLGSVATADLVTSSPAHEATGLNVEATAADADEYFRRTTRGTLGIGAEEVVWTSLVWMPVAIVQLALSRTEGRFKRVMQTRRQWNAYDRVTGKYICSWAVPPRLVDVNIAKCHIQPKERESSPVRAIKEAHKKFSSVTTEAAKARHANALQRLGVPLGYAVDPETTTAAYYPLYLAIARRKQAERVIALDATSGEPHAGLSTRLSHNIHWVRESLSR